MINPSMITGLHGEDAYEAATSTPLRKDPSRNTYSVNDNTPQHVADKLLATARDLDRNVSVIQSCVNFRLSRIANLQLQVNSGDLEVDSKVTSYLNTWFRPINFSVSKRMGFKDYLCKLERLAYLGGRCFCG